MMMKNIGPLPHVPSGEELRRLVSAIYTKLQAPSPSTDPGLVRLRRLEERRIIEVRRNLIVTLRNVAMGMPFVDSLHPFYRELMDLLVDIGKYRHSLAKIAHSSRAISAIAKEAKIMLEIASTREEVIRARRVFVARINDLIDDLSPELDYLRMTVSKLSRLPGIDPELFTIVVAGMPNVGKSSFVRCVSSGKPKIAEYPFTTQEIHVGHLWVFNDIKVQVIDTPGLLDRPLSERNKVELQAVLALRHLANVVVFIVDPTMHSGYPLESQVRLLKEIRENLGRPVVTVLNKADIASEAEIKSAMESLGDVDIPRISTKDCTGCGDIVRRIINDYLVPKLLESVRSMYR